MRVRLKKIFKQLGMGLYNITTPRTFYNFELIFYKSSPISSDDEPEHAP